MPKWDLWSVFAQHWACRWPTLGTSTSQTWHEICIINHHKHPASLYIILYTHIQSQKHQDEHIETWEVYPPKHEADKHFFPKISLEIHQARLFFTLNSKAPVFGGLYSSGNSGLDASMASGMNDMRCQEHDNLFLFLYIFFFGVCRMLLVFTSHWRQPKYTWDIPLPTSWTI